MEKSKQYSDIIALGKLLVDELQLDQSVDTLGRWMAHHITEVMQAAEKATGRKKSEAEERCREAILSLWNHINAFPQGRRPLAEIEPLLATIQALDPNNSAYFYQSKAQALIDKSTLSEESKNWLELALEIDYSARVLISICLNKTANDIVHKNYVWFDLAESLDADLPVMDVVRFIASDDQQFEGSIQMTTAKTLIHRRERLERMIQLSQILIRDIDEKITELNCSSKPV